MGPLVCGSGTTPRPPACVCPIVGTWCSRWWPVVHLCLPDRRVWDANSSFDRPACHAVRQVHGSTLWLVSLRQVQHCNDMPSCGHTYRPPAQIQRGVEAPTGHTSNQITAVVAPEVNKTLCAPISTQLPLPAAWQYTEHYNATKRSAPGSLTDSSLASFKQLVQGPVLAGSHTCS